MSKKRRKKNCIRGAGPAGRAGHTTKINFLGLTLGNPSPYAPAHSFARTHARNATATETEIDFPVGSTPQPPTFTCLLSLPWGPMGPHGGAKIPQNLVFTKRIDFKPFSKIGNLTKTQIFGFRGHAQPRNFGFYEKN